MAKRVEWRFDPQPREHHHTVFHPEAVKGLRFLFPGARPPGAE